MPERVCELEWQGFDRHVLFIWVNTSISIVFYLSLFRGTGATFQVKIQFDKKLIEMNQALTKLGSNSRIGNRAVLRWFVNVKRHYSVPFTAASQVHFYAAVLILSCFLGDNA
jgi:hypothetical protein